MNAHETISIAGWDVQIIRMHTVVIGAGAAGMNCAVHLAEFMRSEGQTDFADRLCVVTRGVGLGASRMSGSDKQTYYKLGAAGASDSAADFAATLTAGGCCHADLAMIEALGSLREFFHLVRAGVPFPHDELGRFVGYKTDHDPASRATSAGPKTSKFMSESLQREVERLAIPIHDRQEVVHLLTTGNADDRRCVGVVTLDLTSPEDAPTLRAYLAKHVVLAAGGPGELYATSVYPHGQVGLHGVALRAGLAAENLTESQFGLASTSFRWNVSGTYMQVVPRIISTNADGTDEREFLVDYYPDTPTLAGATFLKGYQWPFDPQKLSDHGSSLIDLAVFTETSRGRKVFLDFRSNAAPTGMDAFDLNALPDEARLYLQSAGASQATPIERLAHMNPAAIAIYAEHGIDLRTEPLEIAVCAQHCNGGMAIDEWWQSTVEGCFVIGELAGSHGVKRPGGSALNAGQVGGLRAAEYIVRAYGADGVGDDLADALREQLASLVSRFDAWKTSEQSPAAVLTEIQQRMTAHGAHLRSVDTITAALDAATDLCTSIDESGLAWSTPRELAQAINVDHQAITSAAILFAIDCYILAEGGSRGSYVIADPEGDIVHPNVLDPNTGQPLQIGVENPALRESILRVTYRAGGFVGVPIPPRSLAEHDVAFELAWKAYTDGEMFR
jgi:succinate dehydrogenase/fumarate reductase flavoprotein subunit